MQDQLNKAAQQSLWTAVVSGAALAVVIGEGSDS